jgi:2-(1,2-epoxy-1,2-dihydrophenyl)acetyl-CoA isomerase
MSEQETIFEISDGVGVFTLNRPKKMNAISQNMFNNDFPNMIGKVESDESIRSLILTGAGGNFCAGADVGRMGGNKPPPTGKRKHGLRQTLDWIYRLANLDRPVISAVDGIAFGGGFSLALTADIVLATPRTRFCLVFGRIGLIPDMAATYFLPRIIGPNRMKELAFTARTISAEEAMEMGIVNAIHEPDALLPAAREMASRLTAGSRTAMAQAKQLIDRSLNSTQAEMLEAELEAQPSCSETAFHHEAVRRFMHKEPRLYDWDAMARVAEEAE